jgi:hypothetical protein
MGHPRHLAIVLRTPILTRRCAAGGSEQSASAPLSWGSRMALIVPLQFASLDQLAANHRWQPGLPHHIPLIDNGW